MLKKTTVNVLKTFVKMLCALFDYEFAQPQIFTQYFLFSICKKSQIVRTINVHIYDINAINSEGELHLCWYMQSLSLEDKNCILVTHILSNGCIQKYFISFHAEVMSRCLRQNTDNYIHLMFD